MAAKPGTTYARGYGRRHEAERARLRSIVDAGRANCWRCGQWIDPAGGWDLGHDDHDRSQYRGPEHIHCNRRAGARASHAARGRKPSIGRAW